MYFWETFETLMWFCLFSIIASSSKGSVLILRECWRRCSSAFHLRALIIPYITDLSDGLSSNCKLSANDSSVLTSKLYLDKCNYFKQLLNRIKKLLHLNLLSIIFRRITMFQKRLDLTLDKDKLFRT